MARMNKAPQSITINPEKIVRGLTTVFQGFSVLFDGMAEQMQLMQDMTEHLSTDGTAPCADTSKPADKTEAAEEAPAKEETAKDKSAKDEPAESVASETTNSDEDAPAEEADDTPPWEEPQKQDTAAAKEPGTVPAVTITQADLTKVIVSKIKLKRENNAKIGKLLGAYGVSLLSDLPAEKYEAFLNDLSQL